MAMTDLRAEATLAVGGGRAYCTGNPAMQDHSGMRDVATRTETPKVTSLGLPVAREYVILESEPLGDFVHMELEGHVSSPGLGSREDALAEIMIEIAEDEQ